MNYILTLSLYKRKSCKECSVSKTGAWDKYKELDIEIVKPFIMVSGEGEYRSRPKT